MATIKGLWQFNKTLTVPSWTSASVNFTNCHGESCTGFGISPSTTDAAYEISATGESAHPTYYFTYDQWEWEYAGYRDIDFGTTEQTVSDEFYTWFTANAKALVSGVWVFNKTIGDGETWMIEEDISFTSKGISYNSLKFYADYTLNLNGLWYGSTRVVNVTSGGQYYFDDWVDNAYRTITFTEEQAVEAYFYEWFTSNATQLKVTDLTGYTVTVPSGWSGIGNSDTFFVSGTIVGGSEPFYQIYFGNSVIDFMNFNDDTVKYARNGEAFTVTFTGGTDVGSSALIQWFVDNNATFEKTGGEEETPEEDTSPTLSGTWVFDEVTDLYPYTSVSFTSNGKQYIGIAVEGGTVTKNLRYYYDTTPTDGISGYDVVTDGITSIQGETTWLDEAYRTIDFGSTPQAVSEEFYTMFTCDAEPLEDTTPKATITYDGATVTLKEGDSITFRFAEKVFKTDIVIRNNVTESLISFTIGGKTYYAKNGTKWKEWVADTTYNTDGFSIDSTDWINSTVGETVCYIDESIVNPDEEIISDYDYVLPSADAGGGY